MYAEHFRGYFAMGKFGRLGQIPRSGRNIKGRPWSRLMSVGLIAYRRERPQ
jgi:hypothetical protein